MPDRPGLWPNLRHDDRLSGHQPLPGEIRRPGVAWRRYLGGPAFDAFPISIDGTPVLLFIYGGCIVCHDVDGGLRWKSPALGIEAIIGIEDVDLDGRIEIVAGDGKSVIVLDARNGALLWREYLGPPFSAGFMHTGVLLHRFPEVGAGMQLVVGLLSSREVVIYDFTPGAERPERTHILWMDDFFHPTLLAADIDNDGREELIVTKYSAIYVFDPATGELKSDCRWSSGGTPKRNYGLFEARDLNGNGAPDLLILSERVSRHMAVVENDGGTMRVRWDRFIEHIYPTDEKELRYVASSCADVDGDGRLEIVASVFNEKGDGRWWLEVIDAWSGEIRARIPDLYLRSVESIGDSETPIVFVSRESARHPAEFGTVTALSLRGNAIDDLWSMEGAAFVGRFLRSTPTRTVFRTELPPSDGIWCAPVDGIDSVLVKREGELRLATATADGWSDKAFADTDVAAVLAVADLDGDGRTEILISDDRGIVRAIRSDGTEMAKFTVGMRFRYGTGPYYMAKSMQTPVVFGSRGERWCAVPDGGSRIHLLKWNRDTGEPEPVWDREGRGRIGPEEAYHSVATVESNGETMMLMSEVGDGPAVLVAVNVIGEVVRRWEIPQLPASPRVPPGRMGIHEFVMTGNGSRRLLMISGYRSASMNSETTLCLDALNGTTLWEGRQIGSGDDGRGFGPWNALSVIESGEWREGLFLAKDTVVDVNLVTGEFLHPPWQLRPWNTAHLRRRGMSMDDFAAYGALVPVDVDNDGVEEWAVMANYGGFGVINPDHTMRWWISAPLSTLTGSIGGIADVDNDRLPEIGLGHADGDFVCHRADTGEEKWRLHLGSPATGVATCDIDGDGRIEYIVSTQAGSLFAIGVSTSGCGLVKWKIDFGFTIGAPVVADLDGDGRAEVLVVSGDGFLYGVDGRI